MLQPLGELKTIVQLLGEFKTFAAILYTYTNVHWCIYSVVSLYIYILKNEQKSRDAAAKKYRYKRSRDK